MADSSQDRKLPATPRRLDKARKEGQVARSRDLGHFAAFAAATGLLAAIAPLLTGWLTRLLAHGLRFDAALLAHPESMGERLGELALQMLAVLAPLFGVMALVAIAAGLLAGGWNFTLQPLTPKFGKLNPLSGIGRLFSLQQLVTTLKACALALVLGAIGVAYESRQWTHHAELLAMPLPAALASGAGLIQGGLVLLCAAMGLFALVDVPLQRQQLARRLRMTQQEVKQEMKEVEGNLQIKGRIRQRMREMANRRMLAAVPTADLVVMNPTHYAVALKYDDQTMAAPRVVAKGADLMALKIRDLARDARVPVLQAPPLARALYAHTEVDAEIPARLFSAVAQVLAWVYQLRDAMAAGRGLAAAAPVPDVPADLDPANDRADSAANQGVEP
ncbi:MAG: flagellar biosynthesis protein FlhB [Burkholderiales bacterium]|nr:flagellar biosynthesis protein FlhB [Burkholderiales bacterium]